MSNNNPRVIISTDIGGGDADDIQSLVHSMFYLNEIDLKGIIASPSADSNRSPSSGLREINQVIDSYEGDFNNLKTWGDFPSPQSLRSISYPGAARTLEEGGSIQQSSQGADAIVDEARAASPNDKLHVLTWGSPTDVAIALERHPEIADSMVVYTILANSGANSDDDAMDIIKDSDVLLIDNNTTFRGMYAWNSSTYGNPRTFPDKFIKPSNSNLADHFMEATKDVNGDILKMGDTPSFLYVIDSKDNDDPTLSSWGGQFVRKSHNHYSDRSDNSATPLGRSRPLAGAGTVSRHADAFLGDWLDRLDWPERPKGGSGGSGGSGSGGNGSGSGGSGGSSGDSGGSGSEGNGSGSSGSGGSSGDSGDSGDKDILTGSSGDDFLTGSSGDNVLIGVNRNSSNPGRGEKDVLEGGDGNDTFVLGQKNTVFYDDNGSSLSAGWNGRAVILDFNPKDDVIQLSASGDYRLEKAGSDTRIFEVSGSVKDMVAIVEDVTGLKLGSNDFVLV